MNAIPEPTQDEIDAALEREIETAFRAYLAAAKRGDLDAAREAFGVMGRLIEKRSPGIIERMEARLPKKWGTR